MNLSWLPTIVLTLTVIPSLARADVIYSTFDNPPGLSFAGNPPSGGGTWTWGMYNAFTGSFPGLYGIAMPFLAGANSDVTQIDLPLASYNTQTVSVQVGLFSCLIELGVCTQPDSLLGSYHTINVPPTGGTGPPSNASGSFGNFQLYSVTSISGISLQAGKDYWLALIPETTASFDVNVGWLVAPEPNFPREGLGITNDGTSWRLADSSYTPAYFDVVGNETAASVPEPNGGCLLCAELLALTVLLRRHRSPADR